MMSEDLNKRRGRPQKKKEEQNIDNQELFSIHDNIFHAAVLLFTARIFSRTPNSTKFNPTIGYSIYEKVKGLNPAQRQYYSNDQKAIDASKKYNNNKKIVNFYINSLTFAPSCVVDEFYVLFQFILDSQEKPNVQQCMNFLKQQSSSYISFNSQVLEFLDVKKQEKRDQIRELINKELANLLEILTDTLWALKQNSSQNRFEDILKVEEDLFQRGMHRKGRKKQKLDQ